MRLDFYYDIVCPYAYLASTQIEAGAARTGAELVWHPVLLGGNFRHVNADQVPMNGMSKPKARLNLLDMKRWADRWSVPLSMPMAHPRRTVSAMRLLVATEGSTRVALTKALYRAYWVEGRDVADRVVLAEIAAAHGVDAALIDSPGARQGLFDTTAEAAGNGAFGLPASVVDGTLWWGQDRLNFVEAALGGTPRAHAPAPDANRRPRVRFFHDFSSPFSYLAATQIEALAAACRAYDGTLLFVSHDRWFVGQVATRVIELQEDGLDDFPAPTRSSWRAAAAITSTRRRWCARRR